MKVAAGLGLFKSWWRSYGAIPVAILMIAAMFTLGRAGGFRQIAGPLAWLPLALFVARASRRS